MFGMLFKIVAKSGKKGELINFLRWDAAVAKAAEPDTLRFDVWDVPNESDALYVYEAYTDEAAFMRHKANEPYQKYIDSIEPELLEREQRVDLFDRAHSLVSNEHPGWLTDLSQINGDASPEILRLSVVSFPPDPAAAGHFEGPAEMRRLTAKRDASVAHVHFAPGVLTHWHRHSGEQLLWFIEGQGIVALLDGTSLNCRAGDIVRVKAGSIHRHGASVDGHAIHIAMTEGDTVWGLCDSR